MPTTTGVTTIGTISTVRMARMNAQLAHAQQREPEPEQRLDGDRSRDEPDRRPERAREDRVVAGLAVLSRSRRVETALP